MRANTKKRKNATRMLIATQEQDWWADQIVQVMLNGKRALDTAMLGIGRLVAETLMSMEREEKSGPDYHPTSSGLRKWASQRGSIYIGDQKLAVRLRGPEGIANVRAAQESRRLFELLGQVLRGMSARKYEETVTNAGKAFGRALAIGINPTGAPLTLGSRLKFDESYREHVYFRARCCHLETTTSRS